METRGLQLGRKMSKLSQFEGKYKGHLEQKSLKEEG